MPGHTCRATEQLVRTSSSPSPAARAAPQAHPPPTPPPTHPPPTSPHTTDAQHGDKLRLRGKGIFSAERGLKGDQYVEVRVVLPRSLTPRQRDLLEQFNEDEGKKLSSKSWWKG